ncbi:MAG: class I SAM-dependent methyltransferase [Rivularia sp. (in: cyanobacteria)]
MESKDSGKNDISEGKSENVNKGDTATSSEWSSGEASFIHRIYQDYEAYKEHQRSKLGKINLVNYDIKYRESLANRLNALSIFKGGENILCLGARIGTECKAFIDIGCFPIGIDLNPGEKNSYVVHGDFHDLQFADASVDYVFTNSLDHVFNFEKVMAEILRVLQPNGVFIAEIVAGTKDEHGREPGLYESCWWETLEDVINRIINSGFLLERRERFSYPWGGDQLIFRKC